VLLNYAPKVQVYKLINAKHKPVAHNSSRWYNTDYGAEIMLDVGLYRLRLQVACQREAYCLVFFDDEDSYFCGEKLEPE